MFVFIGCQLRKISRVTSVVYDVVDKSESAAVSRCWEWAKDQEDISYVLLWNLELNKLVCSFEV